MPGLREFTPHEIQEGRQPHGLLSVDELIALTNEQKKALGLDTDKGFKKALEEAGVYKFDPKNPENRVTYGNVVDLIRVSCQTHNTGREGLAGPSEQGVVRTGEFLAIVPFGSGYYFVPPI